MYIHFYIFIKKLIIMTMTMRYTMLMVPRMMKNPIAWRSQRLHHDQPQMAQAEHALKRSVH